MSVSRKSNRFVILMFILTSLAGIFWFVYLTRDTAELPKRYEGGNYNIGKTPDYTGRSISMTDITNEVVNGNMIISLEQVVENSIVYSEYKSSNKRQAITSFITPAGRLVTAIAMCEPCRSERFHIEGNILVCDTCGTRWYLNDLRGISGGCPEYPPEVLPYEVRDGKIFIPENTVKEWQPRI